MPNSFNIWKYQNIQLIDYAISLSVSSLEFSAAGGTQMVHINTEIRPTDLNVSIDSDDFTFSLSGYDIQVIANDLKKQETLEKKATLKVTNGNQSATCALSQEANIKEYKEITISSLSYPDVTSSGGTSIPEIGNILQKISYTSGYSDSEKVTNIEFKLLNTLEGVSIDSKTGVITWSQNASTEDRSVTVRLTASANGYSAYIDAVCLQTNNVKTYADPVVTLTYPDILAKGGSVLPELSYSQTWGWDGQTTGGGVITSGGKVTYTGATNTETGEVSALSKGADPSGRTYVAGVSVTVILNEKKGSASAAVYQEANEVSYGEVTIYNGTVSDIPASGGSVTEAKGITASQIVTYTSETIRTPIPTITYPQTVTAPSLENYTKNRTKVGTLIALATGEGDKTATKEFDVYQEKNEEKVVEEIILTLADTAGISSDNPIPASGGKIQYTAKYKVTNSFTSGHVDEDQQPAIVNLVGDGFTVDPNTIESAVYVHAENRGSVIGDARRATLSATYASLPAKSVYIYQAANVELFGEVTFTSEGEVYDIPASGGTIDAVTDLDATQTITYSSGFSRPGDVSIEYSDPITKGSLGTTVTERTKVGTLTATATGEGGKKAIKEYDIYQQANNAEDIQYDSPYITVFTVQDIPASGGTISSGNVEYSQSSRQYYTSKETKELPPITTGGKITYSDPVSAPSLENWTKERTSVGKLTVYVELNGERGDKTVDVYQQENKEEVIEEVTLTLDNAPGISLQNPLPASGGTIGYKAEYSIVNRFTSGHEDRDSIPATAGIVGETYGFSVLEDVVKAPSRGTTVGPARSVTLQASFNEKLSDTVKVYQAENVATYGDLTGGSVTAKDIPAYGGSITADVVNMSQLITYSSGESRQGNVTNSQTSPVIGENLGTKVQSRTQMGAITVTFTGEGGKTKQTSVPVFQEENKIESYEDFEITGGSVPGDIPASGGSVTASGCSAVQGILYTSGSETFENPEITYTTVSAGSLGTDITQRLKRGDSVASATGLGGKTATKSFEVYQQANELVSASEYQFNTTDYSIPSTTLGEPQNYSCNNATALATYTSGESARRPIPTGIRKASDSDTFYSLSHVQIGEESTSFRLTTNEDNKTGNQRIAYLEGYDSTSGTVISKQMHRVIQDSQVISGTNINLHNETNSTCRILSTDLSIDLTPGQEYAFTIIPDPVAQIEYLTYQYLSGTVQYANLVLTGADPNVVLLTGTQSGQTVTFIIDDNFKAYVSTMGREIYLRERTE